MHLAGADFPMRRRNGLTLPDWRPLWNLSRKCADTVERGLVAETEADLDFLEKNWPADLPQGVIHADLFPDNAFFWATGFPASSTFISPARIFWPMTSPSA